MKLPDFKRVIRPFTPWIALASVLPALLAFNFAFMQLFPAKGSEKIEFSQLFPLTQSAFLYQSRNPNEVFGNFYFTLGTQMAARGQLLAAEGLLSKAAALLPNNAFAHQNYGTVLESLEKYPEAIAQYQRSLELDPKLIQSWYSLGLLYDRTGNIDKGIETLKTASELDPDNALISYDLGVLYAKKSDYPNSAIYSGKAIVPGSEFAEAYNNYGYALAHIGRHEDALKAINKSLDLKPDSAATLDSRGFVYFGMGRYQEALQDYMAALQLDPTIGEIYLHLAEVYEKLKTYDKAIKAYETYLQLTPDAVDRSKVEQKIKQLKPWTQPATKS